MTKQEWIEKVAGVYEDAGWASARAEQNASELFDEAAKIATARTDAIIRSMMHDVALSDHLGDAAESLDEGLALLGLPPIPTHRDGTISCSGWLDGVPPLSVLKVVV